MKQLLALGLMVTSFAFAQIWDGGVQQSTDEFTGKESCLQRVDISLQSNTGVSFGLIEGDVAVYFKRHLTDFDNVFNSYGLVEGEVVYLRFPDGTVESHSPNVVDSDYEAEVETAAVLSTDLAYKLMALPGELRVRFEGPNGQEDFTVDHGVFVALAQGFGQTCM
jgi:hypothetical protein